MTDLYCKHCCDGCGPGEDGHSGAIVDGSTTVYINGLKAARIGDPVSCGSNALEGSTSVFVDG